MIKLKNVTKIYNNKEAVKNLSLDIEKSKITVIIGPSGCGKTTTLRMINRLVEPSSGEIFINGKNIKSVDPIHLRRNIGYVIQEIGLFPHYSVFENIATVPRLLKWEESRIKKRVEELLELFNLSPGEYSSKYQAELSGGERQRVGVARALATDPEIVLMDEPFGAIDPINRRELQDFFMGIQQKLKKTVVFVTHDMEEAIKIGDKLVIMQQGQLVQSGDTVEVIEHPKNSFVEDLLGTDKEIRRLMLLKAKDYVSKDFLEDDSSNIRSSSVIINREIDKVRIKYEGEGLKTAFVASPNDNLLDIFTGLLRSGTNIAVIINSNNQIGGIIKLSDIIKEMSDGNS
jgi:osmoprotectant transport system ATP-binding protein